MNEVILANEIIKHNEYYMMKYVDHVCSEISTELFPELATCDFKKLQYIMGENHYMITRVSDSKKKRLIKSCKDPYNRFLVYRATIKI